MNELIVTIITIVTTVIIIRMNIEKLKSLKYELFLFNAYHLDDVKQGTKRPPCKLFFFVRLKLVTYAPDGLESPFIGNSLKLFAQALDVNVDRA